MVLFSSAFVHLYLDRPLLLILSTSTCPTTLWCAAITLRATVASIVSRWPAHHLDAETLCSWLEQYSWDDSAGVNLLQAPYEPLYVYLVSAVYQLTRPDGDPDIRKTVGSWNKQVQNDPSLLLSQAPYFANYFGIHKSIYPGITQLRSCGLQTHRHRSSNWEKIIYFI